ncbi:MAG: DUF2807 domain-containing protein [Rikenellaceae bacterium]
MKRTILILTSLVIMSACSDKIIGLDDFTTKSHQLSQSATAIQIKSAMKLTLSDEIELGEVEIKTNENIHQYINLIDNDDKLSIELESNNYSGVVIEITASSLQYSNLTASGASTITLEGEDISFTDYSITLSGASSASISGYTEQCSIVASGASKVTASQLTTEELYVDLSGASSVTIIANQYISGELSGASTLEYSGTATTISVETSGASVVDKI